MLGYLLVLFIAVPLIEFALLYYVAQLTSIWWTIGLVICTGILGAALARSQGLSTLQRVSRSMAVGELPTSALIDGLMILVAGALLLTPGILTDLFGFSLLTPWCRTFYRKWLTNWFRSRFKVTTFEAGGDSRRDTVIDSHVIDQEESK